MSDRQYVREQGGRPVAYGPHPNPIGDRGYLVGGAGGTSDELAQRLIRDLERADPAARPWGAFGSTIVAFFSLGTLPVLLWHDRFRDFVDEERQHLRRFAEWTRLRSSRPETIDLRNDGEELGTRPLLSGLSILSVVALVVLFAAQLGPHFGDGGPIVRSILANTYEFRNYDPWTFPPGSGQLLFVAWSVALSVAYLFHWLQIQSHASDVRRFVRHANKILQAGGVARVPMPRAGAGISVLWIVGGIFLASKGAWWGLALALSGAAQQRYCAAESLRVRRVLAARVRELARLPEGYGGGIVNTDDDRDAVTTTRSVEQTRRRCPHVRCLATLPPGSRFCPRCGHNVTGAEIGIIRSTA
jgi:hypothetical protein